MTTTASRSLRNGNIEGFLRSEIDNRIARTHIALALGTILMPMGAALDWSIHPEQFTQLIIVRSITSLILFVGFLFSTTIWAKKHIAHFSLVMLIIPAIAIASMMYLTEGGKSNYFFGMILLMVFVQLLGFTLVEAIVYCGTTLVAYFLSVYLHRNFRWDGLPRHSIGIFFMVTSSVLSITICHLNRRNRLTDFRLRQSLDEKNQQLEQLDIQRMHFLANVSHELRTPLTTILGPLDELLATRGNISEPIGQSLSIVKRNADRLRNLVDDLLDIVRIDNAKFRLELEDVDALEMVKNCVTTIQPSAQSRNVEITVECTAKQLDLRVDLHRIERVLLNLLTNAIKFSSKHSAIEVQLTQVESQALISIADRGPGIREEDRERVFERHFQSSATVASSSGGLGIGLAIAREIVNSHGGKIWVEPHTLTGITIGSVFFVSLPIAIGRPQADVGHRPSAPLGSAAAEIPFKEMHDSPVQPPIPFRQPQIAVEMVGPMAKESATVLLNDVDVLIIDDEDDLRMFLADSIRKEFSVTTANNAEEGIRIANATKPKCILLDFMLPDGDGLSVLKSLKQNADLVDTKILMLTAHFDESIKLKALSLGADDFLSKPFGIAEVRARVATLIRNSRLQSDLRKEKEAVQQSLARQREAESQLYQSEKMRAVASMAAGLLHEMNNPISYSLMAVSTLKRQMPRENELLSIVEDIQNGMKRVSDIISDLRSFAYPEQGNVRKPFRLMEAIETAVRFAKHDMDGIEVLLAVDCSSDLLVLASKSQISQVILNLVTNAVRAFRKKSSDLKLIRLADKEFIGSQYQLESQPSRSPETERCSQPDDTLGEKYIINIIASIKDDRVCIAVEDNGPGIPETILTRVMEPFFTTSEPNQGLGLGLSICNSIVGSHGGRLQIRSQVNIKTQITFDLPIAVLETNDDKPIHYQYQTNPVC